MAEMCSCGRPVFAKGLCQSHYRRQKKPGGSSGGPIAPYRERTGRRVKRWGNTWSPECIEALVRTSQGARLSPQALIAELVEAWARHESPPYAPMPADAASKRRKPPKTQAVPRAAAGRNGRRGSSER